MTEYIIEFSGIYIVMAENKEDARAKWCDADFGVGEDLNITDVRENC